jgi:hypothetical protein
MVSARLPMALACERNRLTLAVLSSSAPRDMTDLGICLRALCANALPPRRVPRDVATGLQKGLPSGPTVAALLSLSASVQKEPRRLPQTATRPLITCLEGGQRVMMG